MLEKLLSNTLFLMDGEPLDPERFLLPSGTLRDSVERADWYNTWLIHDCFEQYSALGLDKRVHGALATRNVSYVAYLIREMEMLGTFPTMSMGLGEFQERVSYYQYSVLEQCAQGATTLLLGPVMRLANSKVPLYRTAFELVCDFVSRGISSDTISFFARSVHALREDERIGEYIREVARITAQGNNNLVEGRLCDYCTDFLRAYSTARVIRL